VTADFVSTIKGTWQGVLGTVMSETVYVLLPVHNRWENTERFLQCLEVQTHPAIRLVVIDDGSTDGTSERLRTRCPDAVLLRGSGDWWWAGALQRGLAWVEKEASSDQDIILIMNNDTEFDADFVACGVRRLGELGRALLMGHSYKGDSGELAESGTKVSWTPFKVQLNAPAEEVNALSTRGLFLRVREMRSLGRLRPRLLPHYWSDYEYTMRAPGLGIHLATDPRLKLRVDQRTTGFLPPELAQKSLFAALRAIFSNRFILNPLALGVFVLLACPWRHKAWNLVEIALRTRSYLKNRRRA